MSFQQPQYQPRPIPAQLRDANSFRDLRDGVKEYLQQKMEDDRDFLVQLTNSHNRNAQAFGPNVASAASMQIDATLQQIVTGTAAIDQIVPPAKFNGFKALYSRDGFSLVAGGPTPGAIATPLTTTPGILVLLLYFPPTQEWAVISAVFAGTLPAGSVGPAQLANGAVTAPAIATGAVTAPAIGTGAVTAPAIGSGAVTTPAIGAAAITTPKIASGAATEGTAFTDNSVQNITPYGTPVSIAAGTVTVNAVGDFVNGQVTLGGNSSGIQSGDEVDYTILRGATTIATGALKITISGSTPTLGSDWVSSITFEDSGISGSRTYSVELTSVNGSGMGTLTVQKTAAQLLIIDHKAQ